MEQRLSLVTLGVAELGRAKAFYEDVLGWKAAPGPDNIVFFDLGGLVFSLYPHDDLAKDIKSTASINDIENYRGFSLAHNVRSKKDVDRIFAELRNAGAKIIKDPEDAFWGGYSGYFSDPDGHVWEVAYNPFWTIEPDGRVSMQKE